MLRLSAHYPRVTICFTIDSSIVTKQSCFSLCYIVVCLYFTNRFVPMVTGDIASSSSVMFYCTLPCFNCTYTTWCSKYLWNKDNNELKNCVELVFNIFLLKNMPHVNVQALWARRLLTMPHFTIFNMRDIFSTIFTKFIFTIGHDSWNSSILYGDVVICLYGESEKLLVRYPFVSEMEKKPNVKKLNLTNSFISYFNEAVIPEYVWRY